MSWRHRDILEAELHEPKGFTTANNGDSIWRNEQGLGEWTDREVLPAALNFVDASVAPPTTASGDIYVLSLGASIHANWGTVALKDWVRYDGASWNVIVPIKSILCYDKTADVLMVYDGSAWTSVSGGGGGGGSIYTADGTLTGDRILNLNGNDLTFNNTSSTIPSVTLENTNIDHTAILINKTGSLVAGEKASIDFTVSSLFSSKIENIYHGSNDMSLTFGTSSNLETFRIRNGKIIANGLGVLGSEGVSLQDDTLIQGSNTSVSTAGFKVTDSANTSLLEIKNNGKVDFNTVDTFLINNGTRSVGVPNWNTHTTWSLNNGSNSWNLICANAPSSVFNQNEFGLSYNNSGVIPFRIFGGDKIALGNVSKSNLDTNYSVNVKDGLSLLSGNLKINTGGLLDIQTKTGQTIKTGASTYPTLFFNNGSKFW